MLSPSAEYGPAAQLSHGPDPPLEDMPSVQLVQGSESTAGCVPVGQVLHEQIPTVDARRAAYPPTSAIEGWPAVPLSVAVEAEITWTAV